jgi:phage shock protein C
MENRLYRSRKSRVISGVCGGLGEYFGIDPIVFRITFVLATLGWGASIIAYILLWIFVPQKELIFVRKEEGESEDPWSEVREAYEEKVEESRSNRSIVLGTIFIGLGMVWLIGNFIPEFDVFRLWPLALVGLGMYIIFKSPRMQRNKERSNEI